MVFVNHTSYFLLISYSQINLQKIPQQLNQLELSILLNQHPNIPISLLSFQTRLFASQNLQQLIIELIKVGFHFTIYQLTKVLVHFIKIVDITELSDLVDQFLPDPHIIVDKNPFILLILTNPHHLQIINNIEHLSFLYQKPESSPHFLKQHPSNPLILYSSQFLHHLQLVLFPIQFSIQQ